MTDSQSKDRYTDEEINELAEWLENLSLKQTFFLKESYEAYLEAQCHSVPQGQIYVQ